jgi:immune inhibitor A
VGQTRKRDSIDEFYWRCREPPSSHVDARPDKARPTSNRAYNFLYGDWLEKQCYARGLSIWYRNSSIPDNDTSEHPGYGQILPIDAHSTAAIQPDGRTVWRGRWQTWDSTFGVDANSVTLSQRISQGRTLMKKYSASPVSSFFDSSETAYYDAAAPFNSVKTAGSGLKIDVAGVSADRSAWRVHVYR